MALPFRTTGSLSPAFASARLVGLAVRAPLCLYTRRMITDHAEGTFESLRYNLGGDRPSQTTRLTLFLILIQGPRLESK